MRFDPFSEPARLLEEMAPRRRSGSIPMDAYRRGDNFVIHFDLPGVEASAIDLTAEQNVLTVSVERVYEAEPGDEIVVTERPQGRFSRQVFLGEGLDLKAIGAAYEDGVLSVRIPVAEGARPRRIQVTGTGQARSIPAEPAEPTVE